MQDGPQGIRFTDYVSYFTSSQVAAATWDRGLIHARGAAMAAEAKGKGADVLLGPAVGPLGRHAAGGRNWEGFSPDPYLTGVAVAEAVRGIQEQKVIANVKHYIVNEQGEAGHSDASWLCQTLTCTRKLPPVRRGPRIWLQHFRGAFFQCRRQDDA
jgi:beta-glucosidase-like glycosyl hydrolase